MQQVCVAGLNPLWNLCVEIFCSHIDFHWNDWISLDTELELEFYQQEEEVTEL